MESAPGPKPPKDLEPIIENCLNNYFDDEKEIHEAIAELCTVIDNPAVIAKLIRVLLKRNLEINYFNDGAQQIADRSAEPVTDEHNETNITNHPDAKAVLESYLTVVQAEKNNELAEQWALVIKSFINTAPDRNLRAEYLFKAQNRWREGIVTRKDIEYGFTDMIHFTDKPNTIELLLNQAALVYQEKLVDMNERQMEHFAFNILKHRLYQALNHAEPDDKYLIIWMTTLEKIMDEKGINFDPKRWKLS